MASNGDQDISQYIISRDIEINPLDCKTAFAGLSDKEKLYAHYLCRAAWEGSLICLLQTSPESPPIFLLLQHLFHSETAEELKERALVPEDGLSKEEFESFLIYAAAFYGNLGNYKSFGDTKFVPDLPKEKLQKIVFSSKAFEADSKKTEHLWNACSEAMYSLSPKIRQLGLGQQGLSTYYSSNCSKEDAKFAQEFMKEKSIETYNTRLFKEDKEGHVTYILRIASVATSGEIGEFVSNDIELSMLKNYIHSFNTGSIDSHKDGSRFWIRDKGPIVETYIGFIETYRDPFGVRAEYEGFVSVVNKEMSAKFTSLVSSAEELLPALPWPSAYEKDKFLRPDFTSLDVLGFGSSGIPAGINIPNYDDIRQEEGFKNVSLGNVLSAQSVDKKVTFLSDVDQELYAKLKGQAFEVQVGLHELLGHGSGKLFVKVSLLVCNCYCRTVLVVGFFVLWIEIFACVLHLWYVLFLDLCTFLFYLFEAAIIFGHEDSEADNIVYINWLNMVRAGLLGLEFFTPENNKWRQAHMQARYVILRVLLEAGEGLVQLCCLTADTDSKPDILIKLNREKIESVGRPAIGDFLRKLQVYKSTADYSGGKALYDKYSAVDDEFLALRKTVLARKTPRRLFVQAHTSSGDCRIFGHEDSEADNIVYINWLNMVRAGLLGLEFFTPENDKWRQAHMQARYVILRVLLEAGEGLVQLCSLTADTDGKPDILIKLDREKIESVGRPAIGDFLRKLQVYKSTADYNGGKALYDKYSAVDDEFLALRKTVLARKTPRRLFVQAHTSSGADNVVTLTEFEASPSGMISSFTTRFSGNNSVLEELWRKEMPHHKL
ncbi:PREDICTED: dipeptidyl peptidase 3-like [Acropora digitifera]|uniref:dipeptidyl peptidase 3-like n=1 Tax=Acropora digitifera TaxID=70779 RepID=UPI00077AAD59|nr:PREDICTED: dipeptidyl peptidase 3-like [Acropora digitifera]